MRQQALDYLRKALNNPNASFHDDQWESIEQLMYGNRILLVQRTGWGKSMVYFLATRLLRQRGAGPTLLISPLLSLIRNQIEAAERTSVICRSINSTNSEDWEDIKEELISDRVDVLLISPERLANDEFQQNILANIVNNIGLFVVDEAHCISDWGHDFRPDYRRILRIIKAIPSNVPVLATTATANDRVVNDVKSQLGQSIILRRGALARRNLKLQNINMPSPTTRMAWLVQTIPQLPGSGIVYTLTQRDAERVTEWLMTNHIDAKTYHADVFSREQLEKELLTNEIKVLVSTVALGMGFDKPDLGFVIHYQRPASVVHYYQQVGRAGRAVDEAYGILLCGEEDDHIADYFIREAFPPQQHVSEVLNALAESENGLSEMEMQRALNLRKSQIEKTLKFLTVESPAPVTKEGKKWYAMPAAASYKIDEEYINDIKTIRRIEQKQMHSYMAHSGCLMAFIQTTLDDPSPMACGQCKNCNPNFLVKDTYSTELANQAGIFIRRNYHPIPPRRQWPAKDMFRLSPLEGFRIPETLQAEEGRALSIYYEVGWGNLVKQGKYQTNKFDEKLVNACVEMLRIWDIDPKWVTCIPSLIHTDLVPDFAARLASALGLSFIPCIHKMRTNRQQKEMENNYQQVRNLDGVFTISDQCRNEECLLVDDIAMSKWTFTVASALLRQAGCPAVYPMALALNSTRMD